MGVVKIHFKKKASERENPGLGDAPSRRNLLGNREMGALFRQRRIEAGMSEQDVASYVGDISAETVVEYEAGLRSIALTHVYALSNCLNVSTATVIKLITQSYGR